MNCLITPFSQCFTSILPSAHGLFVDLSTSDIEILITAPLPRGRPPKAAQLTRQRAGRPDRNAWRDVTRAWKALTISARPTRSEQRTCCCGCPWTGCRTSVVVRWRSAFYRITLNFHIYTHGPVGDSAFRLTCYYRIRFISGFTR